MRTGRPKEKSCPTVEETIIINDMRTMYLAWLFILTSQTTIDVISTNTILDSSGVIIIRLFAGFLQVLTLVTITLPQVVVDSTLVLKHPIRDTFSSLKYV
jgi:hypothetical protein